MLDAFAADDTTTANTTATTDASAQLADQGPYALSAEKMMKDNLLILGMLFFIFYFLLIRPQQKRVRLHQEMMKGLAKGNRIITGGGVIGTVIKFEGDDVIVLEVAPNVRIRIARSAVSEVLGDKAPSGESANDN